MTDKLTSDRVRELMALADAADPGPLDIERRDQSGGDIDRIVYGPKGDFAWCSEEAAPNAKSNAEFIVATRAAVPALCAALLAAWEERDRLRVAPRAVEAHIDEPTGPVL